MYCYFQGEEILSQSSLSRIDTTQGGTGGGDSDDETIPDDSDDESDVVGSFFSLPESICSVEFKKTSAVFSVYHCLTLSFLASIWFN